MQISFAEGREQNQVFMDFAHLSIRRNTRSTAIEYYRVKLDSFLVICTPRQYFRSR